MSARFGVPGGRRIRSLSEFYKGSPKFRADMADNLGLNRKDADEANLYFPRQLEFIDKRVFQVKYANLDYLNLLPLISGVGPEQEYYTWRVWDGRSQAQWSNLDSGMSIPKTNLAASEQTTKIRSMVAGFDYNIQEMRAAAATGIPLETMRAELARRGISEFQNSVALFGDTEFGITGLFNQTGVQTYVPSVDTNSAATWRGSLKTSQQVFNDVVGLIDQVSVTTKGVEKVTRVRMSQSNYLYLSQTPFTPGAGFATEKTILAAIQAARPRVNINWTLGLETAGANGTSRMIGYNPTEDRLGLVLPIIFEMFAPWYSGVGYDIACHARMGEVVVRYKQTIIYSDGT